MGLLLIHLRRIKPELPVKTYSAHWNNLLYLYDITQVHHAKFQLSMGLTPSRFMVCLQNPGIKLNCTSEYLLTVQMALRINKLHAKFICPWDSTSHWVFCFFRSSRKTIRLLRRDQIFRSWKPLVHIWDQLRSFLMCSSTHLPCGETRPAKVNCFSDSLLNLKISSYAVRKVTAVLNSLLDSLLCYQVKDDTNLYPFIVITSVTSVSLCPTGKPCAGLLPQEKLPLLSLLQLFLRENRRERHRILRFLRIPFSCLGYKNTARDAPYRGIPSCCSSCGSRYRF
jgi:hypothetical protein